MPRKALLFHDVELPFKSSQTQLSKVFSFFSLHVQPPDATQSPIDSAVTLYSLPTFQESAPLPLRSEICIGPTLGSPAVLILQQCSSEKGQKETFYFT